MPRAIHLLLSLIAPVLTEPFRPLEEFSNVVQQCGKHDMIQLLHGSSVTIRCCRELTLGLHLQT